MSGEWLTHVAFNNTILVQRMEGRIGLRAGGVCASPAKFSGFHRV